MLLALVISQICSGFSSLFGAGISAVGSTIMTAHPNGSAMARQKRALRNSRQAKAEQWLSSKTSYRDVRSGEQVIMLSSSSGRQSQTVRLSGSGNTITQSAGPTATQPETKPIFTSIDGLASLGNKQIVSARTSIPSCTRNKK